jgi:hypothetical protein
MMSPAISSAACAKTKTMSHRLRFCNSATAARCPLRSSRHDLPRELEQVELPLDRGHLET